MKFPEVYKPMSPYMLKLYKQYVSTQQQRVERLYPVWILPELYPQWYVVKPYNSLSDEEKKQVGIYGAFAAYNPYIVFRKEF